MLTPLKRSHFLVGLLQDVQKAFLGAYEILVRSSYSSIFIYGPEYQKKSTDRSRNIAQICTSGINSAFIFTHKSPG